MRHGHRPWAPTEVRGLSPWKVDRIGCPVFPSVAETLQPPCPIGGFCSVAQLLLGTQGFLPHPVLPRGTDPDGLGERCPCSARRVAGWPSGSGLRSEAVTPDLKLRFFWCVAADGLGRGTANSAVRERGQHGFQVCSAGQGCGVSGREGGVTLTQGARHARGPHTCVLCTRLRVQWQRSTEGSSPR